MIVKTTRFGDVEIDESRIIEFAEGILGFPDQRRYTLIQTNMEGTFFWLQALEQPDLAFVVCDPLLFLPDYQLPAKNDEFEKIHLKDMSKTQVFIIVNKVGNLLTGNLQGPLVINSENLQGRQLVLSEKKYSTRHSLMNLDAKAKHVSKTA